MNIRPYSELDESAVIELWNACELVVPWNDPRKDIQRKLDVGRDLFLVAENDEGHIVGSVMGGYEGHRGWINYLAVNPALQKGGLGRLLMDQVEALLLEKGCPKINLMVRASNTQVIDFYERLGFKVETVAAMGKRLIPDD